MAQATHGEPDAGNSHVRFGAGAEETWPGNGARRFIPTLPATAAILSLSPLPAATALRTFLEVRILRGAPFRHKIVNASRRRFYSRGGDK